MESLNLNEEESVYFLLIIEKLEGVISESDNDKLQAWINSDPANQKFYQNIVNLEDNIALLKVYKNLQTDQSLRNLHQKLSLSDEVALKRSTNWLQPFLPKHWIGIAAFITLITFSVFYFYHVNDRVILRTTNQNTKNFILPDGSHIFLNINTEVSYSKSEFAKTRKLKLSNGECFLDIVHQPDKIFNITYKDVEVKDIGTSFSFKAAENEIAINVQTGEVALNIANKSFKTPIKAGEFVSYNLLNQILIKKKITDLNFKAFVNHHLYFNDRSLEDVVKILENLYQKKIIIKDEALKSKKLTAEFKNQKLEDILLVISKTLSINIQTQNDTVYLN